MMLKKSLWLISLILVSWTYVSGTEEDAQSKAYYHFLLGSMKEYSRQYSEAIEEYKEALKYDSDASEIFSRLAYLYIQTNRMSEAVEEARRAIQKNPDNKEAHRMLGQIHMERVYLSEENQEDLKSALAEFKEVNRIDPDDEGAILTLGQLYLQNNQPELAAELLGRYLEKDPDSLTAMMSIASAFQQMNQNEKAIAYLEKCLEARPDNFYIVQQLADLYERAGDMPRALEYQRRAYKSDSKNPAITQKYVELLIKNQEFPEAISILEERSKGDRNRIEWSVLLAKTLLKSGNQEKAENTVKELLGTDPDNVDLRLALVQLYEEADRYQDALNQLNELVQKLESNPALAPDVRNADLAVVYSHLGFVTQRMKNYDSSTAYYQKAVALVQADQKAKLEFYVALNYRSQKKWDEAIAILNGLVKQDPNDTDSWEILSLVYEEKGDPESSDKVIQHLIDTHPKTSQYQLLKAERMQQREKFEESIIYLDGVLKQFPSNDQIYFLLGAASERLKKHDDAEKYFKKAIELNPRNANALNYMGYMFIDRGVRLEEAIEYVKRALEIDRNSGAFLDSLGWGYFKLNKLDLAEDNLRMALEDLEENAVVHDHLGDLYFKLGRFPEAIQQWELAIRYKDSEVDPEYIQKKIDDTRKRLP